jgi:hypothetical protein
MVRYLTVAFGLSCLILSGCNRSNSLPTVLADNPPIPSGCACLARIAYSASPSSGIAVPLMVTFTTNISGTFTLDFGDGSTPASITSNCDANGQSCGTTTHAYQSGLYTTKLSNSTGQEYYPNIPIAAGGTQATPILSSVSPISAHAGDTVTLTGSGFINSSDAVMVDGQWGFYSSVAVISDTTLTFIVPSGVAVGQHQLSIQNLRGDSNSVAFTVN